MNKLIGIVLTLTLTTTTASAQETAEPDSPWVPSLTYTTKVRSGYLIDPTVRLADYVWQNDFWFEWDSGVYVDLWFSTDLEDPGFSTTSGGNEVDLMVGLPLSVVGLPGTFEAALFALSPQTELDNDFLSFKWAGNWGPVTTTVQRMQNAGADSFGSGWFLKAQVGPKVSLHEKLSLSLPLRLVYDTGVAGKDDALIAVAQPKLSLSLAERVTVFGGWDFYQPLSDRDDRSFDSAGNFGLSISF